MSNDIFDQFIKQIDESEDLQAKIGEEITGDALVALGAAHGCEFSIEDVQAGAELSDAQMEGASGGVYAAVSLTSIHDAPTSYKITYEPMNNSYH